MKDENVEESLSHGEVCSMVESGQESGVFGEGEADMINSVLAFDGILAEEAMTLRLDIFRIDADNPQNEYPDKLMKMRYSRTPVYRDLIDNITDILSIEGFVTEVRENGSEHVDISRILRKPSFVLESENVGDLSREMQSRHQYIAISVDEYGGFSGIVTTGGLIEEIMGDIEDEYDEDDEAQIKRLDRHTYVSDGGIPIDDISKKLRLQLENDSHETISGFLPDLIGQTPEDGEEREVV